MNTPLATVFAGYDVDKLPVAFRDQFLATPERPYDVVLEGVMHRIWHRPRWFKPLFKLLGWLGILVPETGESIATTLTVVPGYLPDGQPFHEWNRTFAFPKPLHFNTRVVYDTVQDNLADLVSGARLSLAHGLEGVVYARGGEGGGGGGGWGWGGVWGGGREKKGYVMCQQFIGRAVLRASTFCRPLGHCDQRAINALLGAPRRDNGPVGFALFQLAQRPGQGGDTLLAFPFNNHFLQRAIDDKVNLRRVLQFIQASDRQKGGASSCRASRWM